MLKEPDDSTVDSMKSISEVEVDRGRNDEKLPSTTSTSRRVIGEQKAATEFVVSFLAGKTLYLGESGPYQFVSLSQHGRLGLRRRACSYPTHHSTGRTYEVNLSEASLLLECGSDRVWVFITIPNRYRDKYAWLSPVGFGHGDMEVCGVLVDPI